MRVIGVVDLLSGRAVHARAGRRETYQPIHTVAGAPIPPGDALALGRAYVGRLDLAELYVADLDAIERRTPQDVIVRTLTALGTPVWLDKGVSSADEARQTLDLGVAHVVVGLETLTSYDALEDICRAIGGDRVAFSLDLRDGQPIFAGAGGCRGEPVPTLAGRAADAGVGSVIVIDLARVGVATGLDVELIARVRAAVPTLTLLAGGGVRGFDDLARLAEAGCDGALVATALHDGRYLSSREKASRTFPGMNPSEP